MSIKRMPPRLCEYPFWSSQQLRFADTDRHGHISNAVFAVLCQNARMELLCDRQRVPMPENAHFVIARLVLEFLGEMHWPGTVEIGTRIERVGRSSLTLGQALFIEERRVATAESTVVLIDARSRKSMPLPSETVDALLSTRQRYDQLPALSPSLASGGSVARS
ncbi:MAG TPA: thioesterase family protein [Burkholderiales bacterium]|nr:thioesterase family protein [Burkholderiales bacterium]